MHIEIIKKELCSILDLQKTVILGFFIQQNRMSLCPDPVIGIGSLADECCLISSSCCIVIMQYLPAGPGQPLEAGPGAWS